MDAYMLVDGEFRIAWLTLTTKRRRVLILHMMIPTGALVEAVNRKY
jgi:hypothetical protein